MGLRYLGNIIKPGYNPLASNITTGVNVVQYQGVFTAQQQLQAQANQQWAKDPYDYANTLLLQADGIANGSQNNTFLDSSTNNFTITRNGNTTQGTFSPFSLQPGAWSNYFSATGDNLRTGTMTALGSDFTLEAWVYPTSFANYNLIWDNRTADPSTTGFAFGLDANGKAYLYTNNLFQITTTTALVANRWTHLALVRSGSGSGNCKIYINGVADSTTGTYTTSFTNTAAYIGNDWDGTGSPFAGYISNLRATTGALYTSTFTPNPLPLTTTVSAGTCVLLTCQSNRFVDNSASAVTITANATPSVQAFSPFAPQFQYTATGTGGSGYFDGTGDYLTVPTSAAFDLEGGAYTIELFVYFNTVGTGQRMLVFTGPSQTRGLVIGGSSTNNVEINHFGTGTVLDAPNAFVGCPRSWAHVCVVSNGTNRSIFVNGTRFATSTSALFESGNNSVGIAGVGGTYAGTNPDAYFSSIRIVKGTAVYDPTLTTLTVPTAPLTAITNTQLLCNFTNAGILDGTMKNNLETVGNAQVSTSVVKYGSGSMYFDGTGDYLIPSPNAATLNAFGTGDFTVEFFMNAVSFANADNIKIVFDCRPLSTDGVYPTIYFNSAQIRYFVNNADRITGTTLNTNQWYHVALCRAGTSTRLFVDGVQVGSTYTDTNNYLCGANRPVIGCRGHTLGDNNYYGYIDDLRITKGIARYTQNFIPPSVALPRQ